MANPKTIPNSKRSPPNKDRLEALTPLEDSEFGSVAYILEANVDLLDGFVLFVGEYGSSTGCGAAGVPAFVTMLARLTALTLVGR